MEKEEVLEKLQNRARKMADSEKWLQSNDEKRLAEHACMCRMVNFKVQELVRTTPQNELENALLELHADLLASMENARENQIMTIAELYFVAMDYLRKLRGLLSDYFSGTVRAHV